MPRRSPLSRTSPRKACRSAASGHAFMNRPSQKPDGRSFPTPNARSSARPARATVPSSNKRPSSVTPCGTRRGGENFGSGLRRIGRPVAARFRDVDEAGAQRQRRMSGEVRDRQHLVAQRRHEQEIDLREDPAPSPRRRGAATDRPARSRRPTGTAPARNRLGHASGTCTFSAPALPLSVSSSNDAAASLKRIGISEPYGQSGRLTSTGDMPSFFDRLERGAIDVGGRGFLHPGRKVADAQSVRPAPSRRSRDGSARSTHRRRRVR